MSFDPIGFVFPKNSSSGSGSGLPKTIDLTKYAQSDGTTLNDIVLNLFAAGGGQYKGFLLADLFRDIYTTNAQVSFVIDATALAGVKIEADLKSTTLTADGYPGAIETSFLVGLNGINRVTVMFVLDTSIVNVVVESPTNSSSGGGLPVVELNMGVLSGEALTDAENAALTACMGLPIIVKVGDASSYSTLVLGYTAADGEYMFAVDGFTLHSSDGATWSFVEG